MNIGNNTAAAISTRQSSTGSETESQAIIDERRDHHKKIFYEQLNNEINKKDAANKKGFYVVDREKASKIINYLKGNYGEKPDANFKHYVKDKKYSIEIEGDKEIVYRTRKNQKKPPSSYKRRFF